MAKKDCNGFEKYLARNSLLFSGEVEKFDGIVSGLLKNPICLPIKGIDRGTNKMYKVVSVASDGNHVGIAPEPEKFNRPSRYLQVQLIANYLPLEIIQAIRQIPSFRGA